MVWTSERERMRMIVAMASAAIYIAMVGGRGTDVWRRSSRLGNRVSLMCAADGRRHLCRLKVEQSPAPGSGAGGTDCFGRKAHAGEEMTLLGEDDNGDPPGL